MIIPECEGSLPDKIDKPHYAKGNPRGVSAGTGVSSMGSLRIPSLRRRSKNTSLASRESAREAERSELSPVRKVSRA
jgi:hypothetical protein